MGTLVYSFDMPHMVHVVFQPLPDDLPNVQDDFVETVQRSLRTRRTTFFLLYPPSKGCGCCSTPALLGHVIDISHDIAEFP